VEIENATFLADSRNAAFNVRKSVDAGNVTFINAAGSFAGAGFEDDPFNRIIWDGETVSQQIELPAGWTGLSSYVMPAAPVLEDVFAPIADELIIAQTMGGFYYPGENINTIGNWPQHAAFKVKTNTTCTLPLTGVMEINQQVSLDAGWNLLPVVSSSAVLASDLFADAGSLVIVKEIAGWKTYWPQYGINTLIALEPGKAYNILFNTPGLVNFQALKSTNPNSRADASSNREDVGLPTPPTAINHTIAILPHALRGLDSGSSLGAFDQQGRCFGIAAISDETICLTVFGDDPTTVDKDGFSKGELILFKNLPGTLPEASLEKNPDCLKPSFDPSLPNATGTFTENGLSVITGFKPVSSIGFEDFANMITIFPNPTTGMVSITGLMQGSIVTLSNMQGQSLITIHLTGTDILQTDLREYPAGVYFIKIQFREVGIYRRLILR